MNITNVKIFKTRLKGPVLAYANVILDKKIIIRGIRLIEKDGRKFIAMPSRRVTNGKRNYRDVVNPLNREFRKELTDAIFETYNEFLKLEEQCESYP